MPKEAKVHPRPPEPTLNTLYFGKDDAESDFTSGGLLRQGFLKTHAYEEAYAGNKTLFIGRKGSGKSAICLMLHNSLSKQGYAALITPDEISGEEIRRFSLAGISPETSKELIWRYVFAVQVAKFLLLRANAQVGDQKVLERHVTSIRKFLVDNGELEDLSATGRFWKIVDKLKGEIAFEALGVKLKISGAAKPSPGAYATEQLDALEMHLKTVAAAFKPHLGLKAILPPSRPSREGVVE
jgi:hypothetical protein